MLRARCIPWCIEVGWIFAPPNNPVSLVPSALCFTSHQLQSHDQYFTGSLLFPAAWSQLESILLSCVKKIKTFKLIKLKRWVSKAAQFKTMCFRDISTGSANSRCKLSNSHATKARPSLPTTYLTSATLLICVLILYLTTTVFKLIFRSSDAVLKSKLADARRNDVFFW